MKETSQHDSCAWSDWSRLEQELRAVGGGERTDRRSDVFE